MDTTDLSTAAHRRLTAYPPFRELVLDGYVGSDAADEDSDEDRLAKAWLFQGLDNEGRPFRDPEGSGRATVVLMERSEWTVNSHNTAMFPVLQVLVYADATRDNGGASRDADRKCKMIARTITGCFHMLNTEESHNWPGMFVISSQRSQGLSIMDVPQTEGFTVRGEMRFEVSTR